MEQINLAINRAIQDWIQNNKTKRFIQSDASLWTNDDESYWMGWLNIFLSQQNQLLDIAVFVEEIKTAFDHIILLGMGGSSLFPATMTSVVGCAKGFPKFHVLDSIDPDQIFHLENKINLEKTFFIVSSKSGTTLEVSLLEKYFYAKLESMLLKFHANKMVGKSFIAITDPGTPLEQLAMSKQYRKIFYGLASVGGRYSALSSFGLVPLALMGIDIKNFLIHAEKSFESLIQLSSSINLLNLSNEISAIELGIILGVCAQFGKDKVTVVTSPEIESFSIWLEQLLAESTGKKGRGLIPIIQEPVGAPEDYHKDRIFIYIQYGLQINHKQEKKIEQLKSAGFIVLVFCLEDKMFFAKELLRWEIATAVASSVLGINPYNQPDVEETKRRTLSLMTAYEKSKKFVEHRPDYTEKNLKIYLAEKNNDHAMSGKQYLKEYFDQVNIGDYICISAFIEMNENYFSILQEMRKIIRDSKKIPVCLEFGPRYLHSTGQLHKGGPNTGVFLQITSDKKGDISVPEKSYSFGAVLSAQAQADFEILAANSRKIVRIHLEKDIEAGLKNIYKLILSLLA